MKQMSASISAERLECMVSCCVYSCLPRVGVPAIMRNRVVFPAPFPQEAIDLAAFQLKVMSLNNGFCNQNGDCRSGSMFYSHSVLHN